MRGLNFYAGAGLDRASHRRNDAGWLAARVAEPEARLVPVWRQRNLFRARSMPEPLFLRAAAHRGVLEAAAETVFLGLAEGGVPYVAVDLSHLDEPAAQAAVPREGSFSDIRAHAALLDPRTGAVLAYARGMLTWHQRHRFCGVCGGATEVRQGGHLRLCRGRDCAAQHFPRTDPAVIMLVARGDQCLLGRQAHWPKGMYSTLAGFVEPGESLEEAVAREVLEETGVTVADVRYRSSQPWPFPASIMLGFEARATSAAIHVNRDEIEDARWFSRAFIRSHPGDESFRTPRPDSIARRLIEDWLVRR